MVVPGEAEGDGRERGAKARVAEVGSLFFYVFVSGRELCEPVRRLCDGCEGQAGLKTMLAGWLQHGMHSDNAGGIKIGCAKRNNNHSPAHVCPKVVLLRLCQHRGAEGAARAHLAHWG